MTNTDDLKTPAIEASNLTKVYGSGHTEVVAMKDVSLRVARGEVVALLGPSGAGKSTLLTAIGLINPPSAGRIVINGVHVFEADRAQVDLRVFRRKHLGFVFQKANLIPFLSAVENVQIALEVNDVAPRQARQRALELLDYLGVGDRAGNLPDALSGGEQQRVAIARALLYSPPLLLADEPTGNLDSASSAKLWGLLAEIAREQNLLVLMVTHEPAAAAYCRKVFVLQDGRMKASIDVELEGLDAGGVATRYQQLVAAAD
jgi:putative ABC transport system ATP-binding protein